MRAINILLLLLFTGLLISCTHLCCTPNRPNIAKVCFYGNTDTSRAATENDVLYRCAEITIRNGFDYFVTGATDTTPTYHPILVACSNAGPSAYGSWHPSFHGINSRFPVSYVMIKMFKGCFTPEEPNTYDARQILYYQSNSTQWNTPA
ncbi:MAG: CC0125/CC1285 family lipoprotein [Gammaproteobacteria bacterium]